MSPTISATNTKTQKTHNAPNPHGDNRMKFRNDSGNETAGAGARKDVTMIKGAPIKIA
jgi:hypothetical protein